jgi:acyl carrier protein
MTDMDARIRAVLAAHGRISGDVESLTETDDLYAAGLTSHASVNVMLALEDEFDLEFPERMLRKATFGTIAGIREAIAELTDIS